jgi:hypothetical protein
MKCYRNVIPSTLTAFTSPVAAAPYKLIYPQDPRYTLLQAGRDVDGRKSRDSI